MPYIKSECYGCEGKGYIYVEDVFKGKLKTTCAVCGGAGRTLEWIYPELPEIDE